MNNTAFNLTPEDWRQYVPCARQNRTDRRVQLQQRRSEAYSVALKAAAVLRRRFSATRVILFGSLATNIGFSEYSDIDLAAWGISAHEFYRAVATVTGISTTFKIDLIDPDTCPPSLKEAIISQGIAL